VREDLRSDILERAHQMGDLRTDFVESDTTDGGSEDGPHQKRPHLLEDLRANYMEENSLEEKSDDR
jgi:hypothetical protein